MKAFQGWVDTIEDGRQAVRAAVQNGADFIKVYSEFMTRDLYHAIAEEAKSRRIPFAGHGREPARQHRQHPSDQFRVNRRQGLSQVRVGHYSQRG
jgi:hypothetical protein